MSTPYVGSRVSLISKLDIRYEGVLHSVDTNEATIALRKVKSFGTEDRNAKNVVAPREDVFPFVIFKAADIKDLIVVNRGEDLLDDPAVLSVRPPKPPSISRLMTPRSIRGEYDSFNVHDGQTRLRQNSHHSRVGLQSYSRRGDARFYSSNHVQRRGHQDYFNRRGGNDTNHLQKLLPGLSISSPYARTKTFESDFDFEKANKKFAELDTKDKADGSESVASLVTAKDEVENLEESGDSNDKKPKEKVEEKQKSSEEPCYNRKTSFFDTISYSTAVSFGPSTEKRQ